MQRREFLKVSVGLSALAVMQLAGFGCKREEATAPRITLPELPYTRSALEPYISATTVDFHYGKHHAGYVQKTNALVSETPLGRSSLFDIIRKTAGDPDKAAIFNNAAQVFNHTFYWNSMKPNGGGRPQGRLAELVDEAFGGYQEFGKRFLAASQTQFGSGWVWLVKDREKLRIVTTSNAGTPVVQGLIPLLTLDVWEHAYYLDYQNRRADYAKTYLERLVNWEFAQKNLRS